MDDAPNALKNFVEHCVRNLVEDNSHVRVTVKEDERGVLVQIFAPSDEISKVIGRSGRTIRNLTVLVRSMGSRMNVRASLKINEAPSLSEMA